MATMVPAQKGVEYIFYVCLVSQADVNVMQSNPTLAGGDVTVTTDGNAVTNLDTLPAVDPGASAFVKVTVSGTEMNGDNIIILFNDAAGDEWCDLAISIQTAGQSLDAMDTALDAVPTASEIQTEMEEDGASLLDTIRDKTNNLPTDPADQSLLIAATDAIVALINDLPEDADITTITDAITALNDPTAAAIADAVWDEELTGAIHNLATSAGKRLRQTSGSILRQDTAQAGDATHITLDAGASALNDFYTFSTVAIIGGTGVGQARHIMGYVGGASKIAEVYPAWVTNPAGDSEFVIIGTVLGHTHMFEQDGLDQINVEVDRAVDVTNSKVDSAQDDIDTLIAAAVASGTSLATLIKILTNKWEITDNQLIMYDDDGTTPLYTFDLSRDGTPSEFNPDRREPA